MLKTLKVNYLIQNKKSNVTILKTFRKLCQKFGHIRLFGDDAFTDVERLIEILDLVKRYNNKLTITTDGIALKQLMDQDLASVLEILEQVDVLSLSVNSDQIEMDTFHYIIELGREFNCTIQLYTVLSTDNVGLQLSVPFESLLHDTWVVDTSFITAEALQTFMERNSSDKIILTEMDFYVIPSGYVLNKEGKTISNVDHPSKRLVSDLRKALPSFKDQLNDKPLFTHRMDIKFFEKITKQIRSGKAIFFDIEAVSRKSTNAAKQKIKDYPVPILYSLLKIDKKMVKVIDRTSYSVTSKHDLHTVYHAFFKYVKSNHIEYIVVSNGDLERRFLENCMFYLRDKLSIDDVRYLFKLRDNLIDIQLVLDQRFNSFKLLSELEHQFPDLVTFSRKEDKMSIKINFILDGLIFGPKHNAEAIKKVINYCFEDVYADFELYKFYDYIYKHNLIES